MHRNLTAASVTIVGLGLAATALAPGASAAPSSQDTTFVKGNEQVNLAEITIGTIALRRAHTQTAKSLATKTISDHTSAMAKLKVLAAAEHITLPAAPNSLQQAQAATLKSVSAAKFDLTYLQFQVAGHKTSIADTQTELTAGSDSAVKTYAKYYLPVAQSHLTMAAKGVKTLTGTPTAVPAGNGGQAALTGSSSLRTDWLEGGAGLAFLLAAGFGLLRRRRAGALA